MDLSNEGAKDHLVEISDPVPYDKKEAERKKKHKKKHAHDSAPIVKLLIVSVVCLVFMIVEIVGGLLADSLAIMTDAAHMFSDISGFMISILALWIARMPASNTMSFGYHRAEIVGALCSVLLIWGLTIWLVYEAV
jgi:Co/Zn/Cd efflux system component